MPEPADLTALIERLDAALATLPDPATHSYCIMENVPLRRLFALARLAVDARACVEDTGHGTAFPSMTARQWNEWAKRFDAAARPSSGDAT